MIKIYKLPKICRKVLIFLGEFKESSCFRIENCTYSQTCFKGCLYI